MLTQTPPTAWQPPTSPAPHGPTRAGKIWGRVAGGVIVLAIIGGFIANGQGDSKGSGGSFSVAAGWTAARAADLSVTIRTDDGASAAVADCAMKTIAYDNTWLEWQAMGSAGQLVAIRAAEAGC